MPHGMHGGLAWPSCTRRPRLVEFLMCHMVIVAKSKFAKFVMVIEIGGKISY